MTESEFVSLAVSNYRSPTGWEQAFITARDEERIQEETRIRNDKIFRESLEDARLILAGGGVVNISTPKRVFELAVFLAERRCVHISKVLDEFLKAKVLQEREAMVAEA